MTELEAKSMKKGDRVMYGGEECEILRIHKNPVLVECKSTTPNHVQWHLIRPGKCRKIEAA